MTAPDETAARLRWVAAELNDLGRGIGQVRSLITERNPIGLTGEQQQQVSMLGLWVRRIYAAHDAVLAALSAPPPEALTTEEWSLIERSLARTTSAAVQWVMGTREATPYVDLLAKLRRLRPGVDTEGK